MSDHSPELFATPGISLLQPASHVFPTMISDMKSAIQSPCPAPDMKNVQPGGVLQKVGHDPRVGRCVVRDDDKGPAALVRYRPQDC
jgi:hypothetical protein